MTMSTKLRRLLKTVLVFYIVCLIVIVGLWWTLPVKSVSVESSLSLDKDAVILRSNWRELLIETSTSEQSIEKSDNSESLFKSSPFCDQRFIGFSKIFAKLTHVVLDPSKGQGRRGGENISEVLNQDEKEEYYTLRKGYFTLQCSRKIDYNFKEKSHLRHWMESLETSVKTPLFQSSIKGWTIAVQRYEYVNLYHTMTDYYNAFLVTKVFNIAHRNISILWIDGHPEGSLDEPWRILFGKTIRAGDIRNPVMFEKMIWGIMGYDSPINIHNNPTVPYIEEFRTFVLSRYDIDEIDKTLKCNRLNVTFIWRRNYVAHPRNPSGSVSRKIKNEDELLSAAKKTLPSDHVFGVQIDLLPMKEQLAIISQTDILIGMHGAGLSHTLFLPKHAGLIEFYPTYWSNSNTHFKAMARWRKLHYLSWVNTDLSRELPQKYTVVDTDRIVELMKEMRKNLCQ